MDNILSIKQLHQTSSKYDVLFRGSLIRLVLEPCQCGVHAKWVLETKMKDLVPPAMREMLPDGEKIVERVISEWHFHPTKFQKYILRYDLETQLRKWVIQNHTNFTKLKTSESNIDGLMERL